MANVDADYEDFIQMMERLTDSGNRAADAQEDLADASDKDDVGSAVNKEGEGGGVEGVRSRFDDTGYLGRRGEGGG